MKLKIAIIGCNNMGQKHLNVLRNHFSSEVDVCGIMNSSIQSSQKKAQELNVFYFKSIDEITKENVDAVIISTPPTTHAEIATKLLEKGIPCLVEKPLATTEEDCNKIISVAQKTNTLLLTGHTENYNPAVIALKSILSSKVCSIVAERTSQNADNYTGVSAVQELMIHDLAIVYSLLGTDISDIRLNKRNDLSWENSSIVKFNIEKNATVKLTATREKTDLVRVMDITDIDGNIFHIDFLKRSLDKNGVNITHGGNSLQNELKNFIDSVKGIDTPLIGATEAKDIVVLCNRIEKYLPKNILNAYMQKKSLKKR